MATNRGDPGVSGMMSSDSSDAMAATGPFASAATNAPCASSDSTLAVAVGVGAGELVVVTAQERGSERDRLLDRRARAPQCGFCHGLTLRVVTAPLRNVCREVGGAAGGHRASLNSYSWKVETLCFMQPDILTSSDWGVSGRNGGAPDARRSERSTRSGPSLTARGNFGFGGETLRPRLRSRRPTCLPSIDDSCPRGRSSLLARWPAPLLDRASQGERSRS